MASINTRALRASSLVKLPNGNFAQRAHVGRKVDLDEITYSKLDKDIAAASIKNAKRARKLLRRAT